MAGTMIQLRANKPAVAQEAHQGAHQGGPVACPSGPTAPRDRGSASVLLVVVAAGLLAMVALVVDGGGRVAAIIAADRAAAGAARAAGQAIDTTAVLAGRPVAADPAAAAAAARAHLRAAGVAGEVSVAPGGLAVDVLARATYHPAFLGVLGVGSVQVTGTARAQLFQLDGGGAR